MGDDAGQADDGPPGLRERASPANVIDLGFRAPLDWPWMLSFLGRRLIAGVEQISGDHYQRVVRMPTAQGSLSGWISASVRPGDDRVRLWHSDSLAPARDWLVARTGHLFDLDAEPQAHNAVLGELAADAPGVRVPGAFDGFELAVRAILGQQVTVKAAHTLAGRLALRFGDDLRSPSSTAGGDDLPEGLTRAFPTAEAIADTRIDALTDCGLIGTRAAAIQALACQIAAGEICLEPGAPLPETLAALKRIRGIGDWTASYVAMRALRWADAFPASDLILMRALGVRTAAQAASAASQWQPWRSYAVMHLWRRSGHAPIGKAGPADQGASVSRSSNTKQSPRKCAPPSRSK